MVGSRPSSKPELFGIDCGAGCNLCFLDTPISALWRIDLVRQVAVINVADWILNKDVLRALLFNTYQSCIEKLCVLAGMANYLFH